MAKPPRDHRIDALGDRQKSAYEFPHALSRVLTNPALACNATTLWGYRRKRGALDGVSWV